MAPGRDFLEIPRVDPPHRPIEERIRDSQPVEIPLSEDEVKRQAARCMDCGTPFCHASSTGCPLGNLIPEINEHAHRGRWKEAADLLLHTNCFPEFTGRVCPALCESACVLGLIRPPVAIREIEQRVAEEAFTLGLMGPRPPRRRRGPRVAVVGSGPAGLAVAHVLNRSGLSVTVYERDPLPGGLLRYGIPAFKLEKWVVDRRITMAEAEGICFECGVDVGRDVSYRYLELHFDAIVLATGALVPRDLEVPGRDLEGVCFALDFLRGRAPSAAGRRVVVIGGGDTGADCVGTAWRQGAREVVQLELLPEPPAQRAECTPWPLWPYMRRDSSSHEEGCKRLWGVATVAFNGQGGRVQEVSCLGVDWELSRGRPVGDPRPRPGSEFSLPADLVVIAAGFVGPGHTALTEELSLATDERGFLWRDSDHMSSHPGIFVAGDSHRGPSLIVHAIADGMQTARAVARYLMGV